MRESKLLISTVALAGIILFLVIGYSLGRWTEETAKKNPRGGPGLRRQQAAQTGDPASASPQDPSGRGSRKGGSGAHGQTALREGKPGQTEIVVFSDGAKKGGFTGQDVQKLKGVTIMTRHGLRKGWAVTDVLAMEGIKTGKEVIFKDDKNKDHTVPWERVTDQKFKLALTYNSLGGLVVISGIEFNEAAAAKESVRDLLQQAKQDKHSVFAPNIVRIEVKT